MTITLLTMCVKVYTMVLSLIILTLIASAGGYVLPQQLCFAPSISYRRMASVRTESGLYVYVEPKERWVSRRTVFQSTIAASVSMVSMSGQFVLADEVEESSVLPQTTTRPYAPTEFLMPAVRVQHVIERAYDLATSLQVPSSPDPQAALTELEFLLLTPQNYTSSVLNTIAIQPAPQYIESYKRKRQELSLLEQPGAAMVQNGEIDTWKRLKRQERARENTDEIRAALNVYTANLNFNADSYIFNESKALKSKLIREDKLPDVKTVIASDMGMRYLYRNQVLTAMDEARAELRYQLTLSSNAMDVADLVELLEKARNALDTWLSLIDPPDLREAQHALAMAT